jgi:antitoxin component YwqK of YwqJK toxin-antitoxin module
MKIRIESWHSIFIGLSIIILFASSGYLHLYGQKPNWSPSNREIVVHTPDSTIRAYILIQDSDIPASNQLFYYWYDQEQINKNKGGYAGALLDGSYKVYDWQNNLITQGEFDKGLMVGTWKFWDKNGNLRVIAEYKQGQLHGQMITYDPSGEIIQSRKYRKGVEKIPRRLKKEAEKEKNKKSKEKQKAERKKGVEEDR